MKKLLPLILVLAACGTQKFTPQVSENGGGLGGGPCPNNYDPIPIVRQDGGTLVTLDSLPSGRYTMKDMDYYIHKEDLKDFQIHFFEEINSLGHLQKRICATEVDKKLVFVLQLDGVTNYLNPTDPTKAKAHTVRSFTVRAQEGKLLTDLTIDQTVRPGNFAPVLAKFQQARIYQLSADTYEVRAQSREVIDGSVVTKRIREVLVRAPF